MANQNQIFWPANFQPEKNPIHVHNELAMSARPEIVWAWLIRAQLWPTWYSNSTDIQFLKGQPPNLALGTQFRWKTFGITIVSSVLEFEPNERLAWDAHRSGFDAYHAWLIQKTASGCTVITEETQRGWLARFARALRPQQMEKQHQIWLEGLSAGASAGYPL
ncbi:MAG: SRPBCC domain-containing protein [Candidatus Bathyarchaeia archaeon]